MQVPYKVFSYKKACTHFARTRIVLEVFKIQKEFGMGKNPLSCRVLSYKANLDASQHRFVTLDISSIKCWEI